MPVKNRPPSLAHIPSIGAYSFFIAIFVLSSASLTLAQARSVLLACYGENRVLGPAGANQPTWKSTFSVKLNFEARTITVGNYDPARLLMEKDKNDNPLGFLPLPGHENYGVSTGRLDRVTGQIDVHFISADGVIAFEGICKPAEKRF